MYQVNRITKTILEQAKELQARPLETVYPFLFLDAVHYSVRTNVKVSKTKTVFPTDDSLLKILYLATTGVSKKWTVLIRKLLLILGQLVIHFSDRI